MTEKGGQIAMEVGNQTGSLSRGARVVLVVSVLAAFVIVVPAQADTAAVIDRDDSVSPLDIAAVQHGHDGDDKVTFEVVTYEAWDSSLSGSSYFLFAINTDSDPRLERFIVVRPAGESVDARVFGPGGEIEGFRGYAEGTRPDEHSFRIAVEKNLLKKDLGTFRWHVRSDVQAMEPPCDGESGGCVDWVPRQSRFIVHRVD